MITEDYCSFEVAKLLKEKGFNGDTASCYILEDSTHHIMSDKVVQSEYYESQDSNEHGHLIQAPTHQMAMKWLREVHKIGIFPSTYTFTNVGGTEEYHPYGTAIINLVTYELMTDDIMVRSSYEEAVEAALKYTLENLI